MVKQISIHHITWRALILAALIVTLLQSPGVAAQQRKEPTLPSQDLKDRATQKKRGVPITASISGTVVDPSNAVVAGAIISLYDINNGNVLATVSSDSGEFSFEQLKAGKYKLVVKSPGFKVNVIDSIEIHDNSPMYVKPVLEVGAAFSPVIAEPSDLLVRAAMNDDLETVKSQLDLGRDINKVDDVFHITALYCAVQNNNIKMVEILLSAGAEINGHSIGGSSVQEKNTAYSPALTGIREKTSLELVEKLLTAGARTNLKDSNGISPIIVASFCGQVAVLQKLIQSGTDVNDADNGGTTPLMYAVQNNRLDNIEALLAAGADVNKKNNQGETALILCKSHMFGNVSYRKIFDVLKSHGASE